MPHLSTTTIASLRDMLRRDRAEEASSTVAALLDQHPDHIDLLEIAALAAQARGETQVAVEHLRHVIALAPHARWARDDLAHLLLQGGEVEAAEMVARDALAHDPDNAAAHAFLGQRWAGREALHEAAWHLEQACRLGSPADAATLLPILGRTLLRMGRLAEAREMAAAAMRRSPRALDAFILGVKVAEQAGDATAAWAAFKHARSIAGPLGRDISLLGIRALAIGARWHEALAELDRRGADAGGAALLLRARLRERAGRHDEAWRDMVAGKARLARPYDRGAVDEQLAEQARWPAGLPTATRRDDVAQPIFVMGMPRSGTTLMEQILSAHPDIRAGGELPFVAELRAFAHGLVGTDLPLSDAIGRARCADRHHLPALFRDFYLARAQTRGLTRDVRFFTDKMPLNEVDLPLIRMAFPAAPLLLMRRHPLDVLVSIMAHDMTHGANCGYDVGNAAHHLAAVSELVAVYRERLGLAPTIVAYERLVGHGVSEVARVMDAIGLSVDPAQASFHLQPRHAPTPSHAQVREPLHTRAVGRWRAHEAALRAIIPLVATAMARDGYSL